MKRITILLIILASCSEPKQKTAEPEVNQINNLSDRYSEHYEIYELDGCEYIAIGFGKRRWGSHKGNCKNPIHGSYSRSR